MIDLFLYPQFKVEGNDFVFQAESNSKDTYTVSVSFDDVAAFTDCPVDIVDLHKNDPEQAQNIFEVCQQIVDNFQLRGSHTTYDVCIVKNRVIGYRFTFKNGKTATRCISHFPCAMTLNNFINKENIQSYTTITA